MAVSGDDLYAVGLKRMRRLHLFEIHDQDWCPRMIRDAETDYLQFVIAKTKPYAAMLPILVSALQRTGTRQVLDLCSGAGGPWQWLHPALAAKGLNVSVLLTDKYPNAGAVDQVSRQPIHPSATMPNRWTQREFPRSCPNFERCSLLFIIFGRKRRAPCWPMRCESVKASAFLRAHTTVSGGG